MKSKVRILYKIGMMLVAAGFCLAITQSNEAGISANGFSIASVYFKTNRFWLGLCTWMTFLSAIIGLTTAFFCRRSLCDLLCLTFSIVSGLHFYANLDIAKSNTLFSAAPGVGLYFMLFGWGISFIGVIVLAARKTMSAAD